MTAKIPLQVVELRQPRCSLRFGVGACPATGTPKCYNTWATCPTAATKAVFANTGRMRWRFVRNSPGARMFGDFSAANDPATNGIPVSNLSVSVSKSELNVAGILDGKSPFGVHGTVSVSMDDFLWGDPWGDFYLADRVSMPQRFFWQVFLARNALFSNMELVIYDGYEGDALASMRQRLYILDSIDGPTGGKVTLQGISPLMLADSKRAMFPPALGISLAQDITAGSTSFDVYAAAETDISATIGLTTGRHVLIGSEIIGYTGYSVVGGGRYTLTGCTRGLGGTTESEASAGTKVGRAGHFEDQLLPDIAEYLLGNWTPMSAALIDSTGWDAERDSYLSVSKCNTFIPTPTPVVDLCGELCQQGPMLIWWDEYAQLVKMLGVRPPDYTVPSLTDTNGILADSAELTMQPDARITRVLVYYDQVDATQSGSKNFQSVLGVIEADGELDQAGGEARTLQILGRFVGSENQAYQCISRIMLRYKAIPQMLAVRLDSKDRTYGIGQALDIVTRTVTDSEGKPKTERWQVTSWAEVVAGQTYQISLQDFGLNGRFAWFADNASPDYASASAAQKDPSFFFCDNDGLMADGSPGYLFQ